MQKSLPALIKKDLRLMLSSKFFLLAIGSLVLYSCYINFVYVNIDQDIFPVYLYDPHHSLESLPSFVTKADSRKELQEAYSDGYSVGLDMSGATPKICMISSGSDKTDNYRAAYALSALSSDGSSHAELIGKNDREMKNRREITSEFLFFELSAVGFLGLAAMLFKEKHMGVIRIHGILPINPNIFILSKLGLILLSDLVFAVLLTLFNLGINAGISVLPAVLLQTGILSIIMALAGFFCAISLPDFKQFSLLYLILAIFITTPVFLAGQTNLSWSWINLHPMYHLFMAMKNAYFHTPVANGTYYTVCAAAIILLFLLARLRLTREMTKEG